MFFQKKLSIQKIGEAKTKEEPVKELPKTDLETSEANPENLQKEVNSFLKKMARKPLLGTWILTLFFVVVPAICILLVMLWRLDQWELGWGVIGLERLVTGGTTRILTFDGGQWWRFLTYGFAVPGSGVQISAIILIFAGISFFRLMKLNETFFGALKTLIAFFAAYLLVGFFMSFTCPEVVTGGILPLLGITLGIPIGGLGANKAAIPNYFRSKFNWVILWLLILPLFNMNMAGDYTAIVVGIAAGASMMALLTIKTAQTRLSIIVFCLVLAALILVPFCFALIPQKYAAAPSQVIGTALDVYNRHGLLDDLSKILDRIGWSKLPSVVR